LLFRLPEGTSTGRQAVSAFKTTLFQSFFAPELREQSGCRAVTVLYVLGAWGRSAVLWLCGGDMRLWRDLGAHAGVRAAGKSDHDLPHATAVADFRQRKTAEPSLAKHGSVVRIVPVRIAAKHRGLSL